MTHASPHPPASPYKGLANYTERDAAFFFGRDREREIIIANLKARRLTVLYGETGVGKSSLLRAGVAADLLELADQDAEDLGTPEYVPIVYSAWRDDDALAGLLEALRSWAGEYTRASPDISASSRLDDAITAVAQAANTHLLVILDQFEEYFLYHPHERGDGTFAAEFPRAVNRAGLRAGFLLSIREDALAKLDRFKRDVPNLFDTSLRVSHLDAVAGRAAIVRPVEQYNALVAADYRITVEPALVDAVLDQVRTGQVVLEQAGRGTLQRTDGAARDGERIETPYLQLVMSRLWERERSTGSLQLRAETLAALGGAQEIVRTHLDEALSTLDARERDVAADLFHHLVTPSGSKIAHGASDLAEYARRPEPEVAALLEKLARSDTRIVRPVRGPVGDERPPRFEIFHDTLAPSILDWRTRQTAARRAAEQRSAARAATRRRLFRVVAVLGGLAFAAMVSLALLANAQRNEAKLQRNDARRQERRARSLATEAKRQATRAGVLAREAKRQAARANALTARSKRQEVHSRRLASEARRQATRARMLAVTNRRQAVRARQLAALARAEAALSGELAAFDVSTRYQNGVARAGFVKVVQLDVRAPRDAIITASCTRGGCRPFRRTGRGTGLRRVPIASVVGTTLRSGMRVRVLVARRNIGKYFVFVIHPRGMTLVRSARCRPPGSRVPKSLVPHQCP